MPFPKSALLIDGTRCAGGLFSAMRIQSVIGSFYGNSFRPPILCHFSHFLCIVAPTDQTSDAILASVITSAAVLVELQLFRRIGDGELSLTAKLTAPPPPLFTHWRPPPSLAATATFYPLTTTAKLAVAATFYPPPPPPFTHTRGYLPRICFCYSHYVPIVHAFQLQ